MTEEKNTKSSSKSDTQRQVQGNRTMKLNVPKKGKRTPPGQKK